MAMHKKTSLQYVDVQGEDQPGRSWWWWSELPLVVGGSRRENGEKVLKWGGWLRDKKKTKGGEIKMVGRIKSPVIKDARSVSPVFLKKNTGVCRRAERKKRERKDVRVVGCCWWEIKKND